MIAAALSLMTSVVVAPDLSEFFPLNPGDMYTYAESGHGLKDTFVDTVGSPVDMGGALAYPITTKSGTAPAEPTFYRVTADQVLVVGFKVDEPLKKPYPIIEFQGRGKKWSYIGETAMMGAEAALKLEGSSKLIGQKDVLGEKREVLEVVLDATVIDEEASAAVKNVVGVKTKQTARYARGIGLYEMKEEATLGKQKSTRVRTLTKYEKAKGDSN